MRIAFPPRPLLSQNGQCAAVVVGAEVGLINTRDGSTAVAALAHAGTCLAFDPHASLLAVSGESQLSLVALDGAPRLLTTRPVAHRLYRLAVGEGRLVVGVSADEDEQASRLWVWRGPHLQPLWAGGGQWLGPVVLDGLHVDGQRQRAVYWGVRAGEVQVEDTTSPLVAFDAALAGAGTPFVCLIELEADGVRRRWTGEEAPAHPNGFLLPLAGGRLGAYSRDMLAVFAPGADGDGVWKRVRMQVWGELETVVTSPAGTHLAWLWSTWEGDHDHYHLRVATLEGGVLDSSSFESLGDFPMLAVDDEGCATLVSIEGKNRIVASTLEHGRLIKRAEVDLSA